MSGLQIRAGLGSSWPDVGGYARLALPARTAWRLPKMNIYLAFVALGG